MAKLVQTRQIQANESRNIWADVGVCIGIGAMLLSGAWFANILGHEYSSEIMVFALGFVSGAVVVTCRRLWRTLFRRELDWRGVDEK